MNKIEFAEILKKRTKAYSIDVIKFCNQINKSEASRVVTRQLIRSST